MNLGKLNLGRMKRKPVPVTDVTAGRQLGRPAPVARRTAPGPVTGPGSPRTGRTQPPDPTARARVQAARQPTSPRRPSAPAAPAVAEAARRNVGAFSGALNNLDDQQQRVNDVAARRSSDAAEYAAYVMGQQGTVAAAAAKADQQALANIQSVQGATQANLESIQGGLAGARAAQGISGAVPSQQLAPVAGEATRIQQLLGAAGTQQAVIGNANVGRAQFLTAAAQANMLAHQRSIAGDAFNQTSEIGAKKTDVLMTKTQEALATKRAQQAAAAEIASAQIDAQNDAADRASREAIAADRTGASRDIAGARIASSERQGSLSRQARLKQTRIQANARIKGSKKGETPAQKAKREQQGVDVRTAGADANTLINAQIPVRDPKTGKPTGKTRKPTEAEVRAKIRDRYDDIDIANAAMDIAILGEVGPVNRKRLEDRGIPVPKAKKSKRGGGGVGGVVVRVRPTGVSSSPPASSGIR